MKLLGSSILRNLTFCNLEDYLYIGLTPLWYLYDTAVQRFLQVGKFHIKCEKSLDIRSIYKADPL